MPDGLHNDAQETFELPPGHRFSPEQERQFEADTGPDRCRSLFLRGLLGIGIYLAYLGMDWLLTPDALVFGFVLRAGIMAPLGLAAFMIVRTNPRVFVREGIMSLATILAGAMGVLIVLASDSPLRDHYHHTYILLALYAVVVLRLRFPYAVVTCIALLGLDALSLAIVPEGPELAVADLVSFTAGAVLCLIAAGSFERSMRIAYLQSRRQHQRTANLEDLSRHDPLTGLGNRRALDDALAALGAEDAASGLGIVVADIDHFKSYNDAFGHQAGDVCLKRVANLLAADLRNEGDIAIRFGGEEFVVLLPRADLATAVTVAERMRRRLEDARIPHPGRTGAVVTASFGAAAGTTPLAADEIIAAADSALYAAKNSGRNRVWPQPAQYRRLATGVAA